ncbi:MAG: phosphotransferase [Inquilinus sp.]|nr:phosphotransferase [Inquilinus sp.]
MEEMTPDPEIVDALRRAGLLAGGADATYVRLEGGVSSDIWRVDAGRRSFCVKRALPKLRVAADWRAPVERNLYEARWMRWARRAVPGSAPELLAQDESAGLLAMAYLPASRYPLWKAELRAGRADPAFAASVGRALGRIHAATADNAEVAGQFPTDAIFHDIRLEPYLVATARAHPDLAGALGALVERTAGTRLALVHGDVSPKNILRGAEGPVFLDAECAWYGDPAFDVAFCLNHLLLKCLWVPVAAPAFLDCFDRLAAAYRAEIDWESGSALEWRAATLLPGLFLARVDGKSPVEYLTDERDKDRVRRVARALLEDPVDRLSAIRDAWAAEVTP